MISGDIHEELARTNVDNCMGQMIRGANLIAQALMFLAPHFNKVRVPCVVGNHGRMTRKPPMKDKHQDWDYMLYQWVAAFCRNQNNIEFHIPKTFTTTIEVANRQILLTHGDFINGAGSGTAITKGVLNMRNVLQFRRGLEDEIRNLEIKDLEQAGMSTYFDTVLMGHFHRIDEIDVGTGAIHICGCMKGGDEFAMQRVQAINKPRQLVLYYHPKYGEIGKEIIYLNRYDAIESEFNDVLPEVWHTSLP
jgi:predicted phosphodiesterase